MSYRLLAAATLAGCFSVAAHAATSAGVSIEAPLITLSDLDPGDGRSPLLSPGGPRVIEFDQYLAPAPVWFDTWGAAEITADEDQRIGGRTMGPGSGFIIVGDRWAPSFTFTVSGRTGVTLQTPYTLGSAIDGEGYDPAAEPARTHASFELMLVAVNNFAAGSLLDGAGYDMLAVETGYAELASPLDRRPDEGPISRSGVLSVSFDNPSDGDAVFAFRGEMVAWGVSGDVSPVPEPGSMALMLLGLVGVGAAARWRRR